MTPPVTRSPIRLARPYSPIPIAILVLFVWWVVAHNSGSGWVQVLGDAVFGMLLIGLFAPAAALARIRLDLTHLPSDGVAGMPLVVTVSASGRARVIPADPPGPEEFVGRGRAGMDREVTLLPEQRGVHHEIALDIATAAPFCLQWWTRTIRFSLSEPLHVAPRVGRPIPLPTGADERTGNDGRVKPAEAGDARGVRDYMPGDRRRRVHWGATAHSGRLMVREMEEPASSPVTLKVSLPSDPEEAEGLAESAMASLLVLLDRGLPVVLVTDEGTGRVIADVANRRDAGRRLARATSRNDRPGVELVR